MYAMTRRIPWRPIIAGSIVLITFGVFIDYLATHPVIRDEIRAISPWLLAGLLGLYTVFLGALALVNNATIKLCKVTLPRKENLLLTMYSSVINFFGPLQSGPAFRAVYLKQKHDIKITNYTSASFLYYFLYALFSGIFLLSGLLGWWLVLLGGIAFLCGIIITKTQSALVERLRPLALSNWRFLALATFLQVCVLAVIYYVELLAVMPTVSVSQAIIYTGAANFALFVSITPGAIGFRESFLLFTEKLHHIDAGTIVAANTIDRAVYIIFLGIVALFIFGTHAHSRFVVNNTKT